MKISRTSFGHLPDGREVFSFSMSNGHGMQVDLINYGGIITALHVPDRDGTLADVVLGYDDLQHYVEDKNYFGAVIGRYANRIGGASFEVDGMHYQLEKNNGPNHLHGGSGGFHKVLWDAVMEEGPDWVGVALSYRSNDGDQGYPGNLDVLVRYQLNQINELQVHYSATTDQATPVNLTQHSYFNLAGRGDILTHQLMINADAFSPVDQQMLPERKHRPVAGTPFDFQRAHGIGERIEDNDAQLRFGHGYDHNYVVNPTGDGALTLAASVVELGSGRCMELFTEEPGVQFYSGNFLDGLLNGKNQRHTYRSGFCLEPQHFPDSPNCPEFPDTVLVAGEQYSTCTVYRFSVVD